MAVYRYIASVYLLTFAIKNQNMLYSLPLTTSFSPSSPLPDGRGHCRNDIGLTLYCALSAADVVQFTSSAIPHSRPNTDSGFWWSQTRASCRSFSMISRIQSISRSICEYCACVCPGSRELQYEFITKDTITETTQRKKQTYAVKSDVCYN